MIECAQAATRLDVVDIVVIVMLMVVVLVFIYVTRPTKASCAARAQHYRDYAAQYIRERDEAREVNARRRRSGIIENPTATRT